MKKLFTLLALTISFSMNAQVSTNSTSPTGTYASAMGYSTTASGYYSTTMGYLTTASDYASLVIGQYNSSGSSVTNNATSFNTANTAFVIGNGTASNAKSDAFKVMFNGDTTVSNDLTVVAMLIFHPMQD